MELTHSLYIINTTIAIIIIIITITIVICIIVIIIIILVILCPWRNSVPRRVSAAEQCSRALLTCVLCRGLQQLTLHSASRFQHS